MSTVIDPKLYLKYAAARQESLLAAGAPQSISPESQSQYDKGFVIPENDPYKALNEQRAAKQTALDKFGNGLVNMGGSAFTGALESTVGFAYGAGSALINWDADKLWKNAFTENIIDPINEWKQTAAPFYYSEAEKEASVLGSMGYQNFWFDKVMGGAGYTIGSIASGYGLNALFGMSKAAVTGKLLKDAASGEQALTNGLKLSKTINEGLDMGKQVLMGTVMAHGESALEARETYNQMKDNILKLKEAGVEGYADLTDEEVEKLSIDAGNTNYVMNLAITGPTDMLLLNRWINPGTKQAAKKYNEIAKVVDQQGNMLLKDATLDNAKRSYLNLGSKFLEGFRTEAFQEGAQFAANIGAQEFVKNYQIQNLDWLTSLISGLAEGVSETLTSKEGLESMLVGGITGGPFATKGAKSERLARELNTQKRINAIKNDPEFLQGGSKMANYIIANNALNASEEAKKNNNLFEANNKEAYAFGKYVQSHIESDTVDLLKEKLDTLKQAPDEEFNKFFGFTDESKVGKRETIDKLLTRIDRLNDIHSNLTRVYGLSQGTPEELAFNNWTRNQIFEASFTLDNIEEREKAMGEALVGLTRNPMLLEARKKLLDAYRKKEVDLVELEKEYENWEKAYTKTLKQQMPLKQPIDYDEYRKLTRETYRKEYNDAVKKVIDENPVIADEISELLVDLNKNAERREKVINYLNALKDPTKRIKVKQDFDKAVLKQIAENIKTANAEAGKTQPVTEEEPITTEEEVNAIIPPSGTTQKFLETPGGEKIDVGGMTVEELSKLKEEVIQEMASLSPEDPAFNSKQAFAVALEEELNLRTNGDAILKNLRARYRAATTLEEKRAIFQEAASKGFPINPAAYERDVLKFQQQKAVSQQKEEVKQVDEAFSKLFKGAGEFQDVVMFNEKNTTKEAAQIAEEAFAKLTEDPDFKDKITIEVQKNILPAGPIRYGVAEKGTEHPTLGKQRSNYNVIVKYNGTPVGFVVFYDTFVDKATGKPVDILNLDLPTFNRLFNPTGTPQSLEAFKLAYAGSKMFHNYITSEEFLAGKNYATIPNGKLLDYINPYITSGTFAKVDSTENLVPLSQFTLHRNTKGEATIVDTSPDAIRKGGVGNVADITVYETSNTEAYKSSLEFDADGNPVKDTLNEDLIEAFTALSKMKAEKNAYSRYWALAESPGGPIKIKDKQYRWVPLTPSSPYSYAEGLMKSLNTALDNDPKSSEERGAVKKKLNEGLFIAFGDNGTYESKFRVDIQPEYEFTNKDGKKFQEGYTLKIYSPSFFRHKAESGETNGIKWKIINGALYLTIRGRVDSFDVMVQRFEAMRTALADSGGPLVGTTPFTTASFKDNPVASSSQTIRSISKEVLESGLASVIKPKTENQKLVLQFNVPAALAKASPQSTSPVATPTTSKEEQLKAQQKEMLAFLGGEPTENKPAVSTTFPEGSKEAALQKEAADMLSFMGGSPAPANPVTTAVGTTPTVQQDLASIMQSGNEEEAATNWVSRIESDVISKGKANVLYALDDIAKAPAGVVERIANSIVTQLKNKYPSKNFKFTIGGSNNNIITVETTTEVTSTPTPSPTAAADKIIAQNKAKAQAAQPSKSIPTKKVISGVQTGVDSIGLEIAKSLGYETGGTAPREFLQEGTKDPSLASKYGVQEISPEAQADYTKRTGKTDPYTARTEQNVKNSDGTVYFFTPGDTMGRDATKREATKLNKPFIENPTGAQLKEWLVKNNIQVLNVAGNRGSKLTKEKEAEVRKVLEEALGKSTPTPTAPVSNAKADIERRRQERLKPVSEENPKGYFENTGIYKKDKVTGEEYYDPDVKNGTYSVDFSEDEDVDDFTDADSIEELKSKINAKYDAELAAAEQPEVKPKSKPVDNFNQAPINAGGKVFSRVPATLTAEEQIQFKEAFDELRTLLPNWINVTELDALEQNIQNGVITLGYFYNNVIKLASLTAVGTQYHEAFHAVFRTMLTNPEQNDLYAIAKEELRDALKANNKSYADHKKEFLKLTPEAAHLTDRIIDYLILEEYMADKFKEYMKTQKTKSRLRKFFDRLLRLLRLTKTTALDRVFSKIEKGKYKNANRIASRFDTAEFNGMPAYKSIFLRNETIDGRTHPIFLNSDLQINEVNKITGMVLEIIENQTLSKEDKDEDLNVFNNDTVDQIIDRILNGYATDFFNPAYETTEGNPTIRGLLVEGGNQTALNKFNDLMFLYNNTFSREQLKQEVYKNLNNYNVDENADYSLDDNEISDTSPERNYEMNQENVGGIGSLTKKMRKYIATTTSEISLNDFFGTDIEEFGYNSITVAVDPKKVYNGLTKIAQNQADINNVLNIMADQLENNTEMSKFIARFFADANIGIVEGKADLSGVDPDKQSLVQMVAKAFNLWSVDYKFTSYDPANKLSETINANLRTVESEQVAGWSRNFLASKYPLETRILTLQRAIDALQEGAGVDEFGQPKGYTKYELSEKARLIAENLKISGINLSPGYIKYLLLANPNLQVKTPAQENTLNLYEVTNSFATVIENLNRLKIEMSKGTADKVVNPFERAAKKEEGEERGAVTRALEIAKDNALFDESVAPATFINAEGKTIYGLQTDTYHIRKIFEIATSENWSLEVIKAKAKTDPFFAFIENNYLLNSENFETIKSRLKIVRIDGLRERSISYNEDSKDNSINIDKRQTDGVTYGSMSDREYAMLPYLLYADTKETKIVNGKIVKLRPVLLTVMETANTGDAVNLEVVDSVDLESGKIKDTYLNNIYNILVNEHARIKRAERGEFKDKYLNFNYGPKERAKQFWADNKVILESIYGANTEAKIEELIKADSLEPFKAELTKGIEDWLNKEVDNHIDELIDLGIVRINSEKNLENVLLPKGFSELLANDNPNKLFPTGNLKVNIKQAYLSNLLNTHSINELLSGDPAVGLKDFTDKFKRDKGANASGANTSRVNFPNEKNRINNFNYVVYITKDFDEVKSKRYALSPTKIVKVYQDNKPETPENYTEEFKNLEKELTPEQLKQALKKGEIPVADAQGHGTVGMFREIYDSLGRMTTRGHEIYDMIEKGETLKPQDHKYLKDHQIMLNSLKMVYYDGQTYIKLSIAPLTKSMTSYKKDGKWVAQRGLEWEHDMRTKMEQKNIHLIGPVSMSKKTTKNPLMLTDDNKLPDAEVMAQSINVMDRNYFKLQQENPSNKLEIKDPTQMLQILVAEQKPDTVVILPDGTETTVGAITKEYSRILGDRVLEMAKYAKAYITEIQRTGPTQIKLKRLINVFREVVQQTGGSEKMLALLEVDQNGDPLYDINLPDVVTKFEEMFNAHFNKVFSQKIPGYKTTLQSDLNHNIIYEKATGKIITRRLYLENPAEYANEEKYGVRRLAFDQPRIEKGKLVGKYAEIILPFHFAAQFGLKPGDEIPEEIAYLFGVRIPSQDKHSAMSLKIVDILPPEYGSNAIFPEELIILTGSDFDIDSFYIHRPDHYVKYDSEGTPRFLTYGNKEDSAFDQHMIWHSEHNIFVDSIVVADKKLDTPLAIKYREVLQEYRIKKTELSEKYEKKKHLLQSLDNPVEYYKLLKEIPELQEKLSPLKKELEELEKQFVINAMKELNIPTTEEAFNREKPKNVGTLNNRLLDLKIALHTNSYINDTITKTPATLRAVEEEMLPELMTLLGFDKKGENFGRKVVSYATSGLLKAFSSNKAGGVAIGAAVNAIQQYSIFSRYGLPKIPKTIVVNNKKVQLPFNEVDGIKLEGVKSTSFQNKPGLAGKALIRRVMDVLSTLASSMTDNGKYLFNKKLNIDLKTLGVVAYGLQQGIPAKHMTFLINNEYVLRYIKLDKQYAIEAIIDGESEAEIRSKDKANLLATLEEKIKKGDPNINFNELKLEPITYEELTRFLPYSSNGANYLKSNNKAEFFDVIENREDGLDFLKAQYKLLNLYTTISNEQMYMNAFTNIIKLTKGIVGVENDRSFSADDDVMRALDTLNISVSKVGDDIYFTYKNPSLVEKGDIPYDFLPIIQNDPLIRANLTEFFAKQEISKEVFVSKTKFAKDTLKLVTGNMTRFMKTPVKRKILKAYRRNFESYFNALAFRKFLADNGQEMPSFSKLLFKALDPEGVSIEQRILNFRKANPRFNNNLFFRLLAGEIDEQTSFENLGHNTRSKSNAGFESRILDAYDEVFNFGEEGRALANDLFFYQMARYGLQFKNNSFVGSIAAHRFKVISMNIKEMLPLFNRLQDSKFKELFGVSKQEAVQDFLERFFRDINNSRAVSQLYNSKIQEFSFKQDGKLVFPVVSTLINPKTKNLYTAEEATALRNRRHNYIGAVETKDGNRSTAFPLVIKVKERSGDTTTNVLYVLESLNGKPIDQIDLLTAFPEENEGKFNGASATYVPVNYVGSNIAKNTFLPYTFTKEELEEVTQHIQNTVGKNAKPSNPSRINEDADAEAEAAITAKLEDMKSFMESSQQVTERAEQATGFPLKGFEQESAPTTINKDSIVNATPNPVIKATPDVETKATLSIVDAKQKLANEYLRLFGVSTEYAQFIQRLATMTDAEVIEEYNKLLKC